MRDQFELVRGGVSEKDLVPVLTHFAFHEGRVYAANGRVQISAPVPELSHLSLTVPAHAFIAAMDGCEEAEPTITHDAEKQQLTVKGKKFSARIPTYAIEEFPMQPLAQFMKEDRLKQSEGVELMEALRTLRPLMGEDASRPWCATVLVQGGDAFATNNIVLAAHTAPAKLPAFSLPVFAVDELLRIDREPTACVVDATGVDFELPGDVTLRAQLLAGEWPNINAVLDAAHVKAKMVKVDGEGMCEAIRRVTPFCDDPKLPRVNLKNDLISAVGGAMSGQMRGFKGLGQGDMTFHAKPLLQALALSRRVGWAGFPRVPFDGDRIRGVILGLVTR